MNEQVNYNLTQASTWKRIFFMMVFAAIGSLVRIMIWGVILLQVGSTLLTGKANPNILSLGQNLSSYTYHILLFMTFNTETLPFPFSAWNLSTEIELINK